MNLKGKIDLRAAVIRCKKAFLQEVEEGKIIVNMGDMSFPPPPSTPPSSEEAPQSLTLSEKQYEEALKKFDEQLGNENPIEFFDGLKSKLDEFKDITDSFLESIKNLEDPEIDEDVRNFANKCMMFTIFIKNSFDVNEPVKKEDFISMMTSVDLEEEYIALLQKFYFSEGSTRDIIQTFL